MINRRSFIRKTAAGIWVPAVPQLILARKSFANRVVNNIAAGGCTTARDANVVASNGTSVVGQGSANTYVATFFTAAASYTSCALDLYLDAVGSPNWNLFASIYSDDATDEPNTIIGSESGAVATTSLGATEAAVAFTLPDISITSATKYWIVIRNSSVGDVSNYVRWYRNSNGPGTNSVIQSSDGTTWSNVSSSRRSKFQLYST